MKGLQITILRKAALFLQFSFMHKIFTILVVLLFISGCANYERTELIEGIYYPNGNVQLVVRPAESPNQNYYLTINQPFRVNEIGVLTKGFFDNSRVEKNEKVRDGFASLKVGKSEIPGLGECYIPVYMLIETGHFEYHARSLTYTEWLRENPILTIFLSLILLILIIIVIKYFKNKQKTIYLEKQREAEEKEIRDERLSKEKELKRRKDILQSIINTLYKETAIEVNKTLINTLLLDLQDILFVLNSGNLNDVIIGGNFEEFQNQINLIVSELQRLKKLALDAQAKGYTKEERWK